MSALEAVASGLRTDGYAFAPAAVTRALLGETALADWAGFAASWDDLGPDLYMADGGRYRRRRHAVFEAGPSGFERRPDQPHYQSRDFNPLNGGIARWFAPMAESTAAHPALHAVLDAARRVFAAAAAAAASPEPLPAAQHVELHQFRIEAAAEMTGQPTPEGAHRDGVDWVLVLLIARENVGSGETTILGADRAPLGSFTLTAPLDAAFVDDWRVYHGVTGVVPVDPDRPAWRDVLVVTFRHA